MSIFSGPNGALFGLGALNAGTSVIGSIIGSNAAGNAAGLQANAADRAAQLQKQAADQALNFQRLQFGVQQSNMAPWLQAGRGGLANLMYLMGIPMGGSGGANPFGDFTGGLGGNGMPNVHTLTQAEHDPGSREAGREGMVNDAIINRAAGNGGWLTPGGSNDVGGGFPNGPTDLGGGPGSPSGGANWNQGMAQQGGLGSGVRGNYNPNLSMLSGSYDPNSAGGGFGFGSGTTDLSSQVNPNLGGFGSLMQGWDKTFQAPTDVTERNDPGYQFRLKQGQDVLEHSAAARGGLLTGGTGRALQNYGQDYASNEYGNVYNRALGQYQDAYNVFKQNQADRFNRLAAISGIGQTAAGQLNSASQNASNNYANILLGSAGQIGQQYNNAAAARASGYIGGANAISGGLSGISNNLTQLLMLRSLTGGGGTPSAGAGGLGSGGTGPF